MKNFFKKLAFVLALAMVVTAIAPAGKASAAAKPALAKSSKVLYIGGDKTGAFGDTYSFKVSNAKGYKVTWKSSNKKVATVDAKSGKVQAVAVGTSNITATVSKSGKATELVAKVWVKQNAEKIGFGTLAKVKELAVGDKVKVNAYRQVGTTKVWKQADKTLVTDYIKWTTSDPSVATVSKWGTVTAVAAGKATITATATQTEKTTAVVSKSFEVTVAAGLTAVKQTGLNTIEATFAGDLSAVANKDNVKVFAMVGTTPVVTVVKEVKFDATDKTKATITTFVNFTKDVEYVVEYKDTKQSFKGVDTSKDAVKSIVITTTTAVPNTATEVKIKVLDANGVDITKQEYLNSIDLSFATATSDGYLDSSNKKVTIFYKDKSVNVKAAYHTYTYGTDYKEIMIEATQVITGKPDVVTVPGVDTFTVYNNTNSGKPDFANVKNTISITDNQGTYSVAVQTKNSKGDVIKSTDSGSKFKFSTSDQSTLIVSETGVLFPVKEGAAQVLVKYDDTTVGAFTVTIGAKRVAYDVQTTLSKTTLASGSAVDSIKLTVEVKDQYGDKFAVQASAEFVTGAASISAPGATYTAGSNKTEFTFPGTSYHKGGTYQYKVKAGDQTRYVSFTVDGAKSTVDVYRLSNAGKTVDSALKYGATNTTDSVNIDMDLESFGSNGYKIGNVNVVNGKTAAWNARFDSTTATGDSFYVEIVDADNKAVDTRFIDVTGNRVTIKPVVTSGTSLVKLKAGNYTVKALSLFRETSTTVSSSAIVKGLTVASFVVTDTQTVATYSQAKSSIDGAYSMSSLLTALQTEGDNKFIEVKIGNEVVNAEIFKVDVTGADKTYTVTKLYINVPVKYTGETATNFVQEVAVAFPFTFAN